MATRDPRIDAYIANSADFAKPVLTHLRELVHRAAPEIEETMKWSFPHFVQDGIVCSMASFKAHCAFGFWKSALVLDGVADREAMGQFGRITSVKDLPGTRAMTALIRKAVQLNADGVTVPKPKRAASGNRSRDVVVPPDLAAALGKDRTARDSFEAFSPSHRREYVEWITEAKRDATRQSRIAQAIEMLRDGKSRNWKYAR